jgi:asparagine synthase (glutamine-hydrolysing)
MTVPRDKMTTMAGLLTFVSARGDAATRRDAVVDALFSLAHRGSSTEVLATADVIFGGGPTRYPPDGVTAGRYVIAFDGAVYNAAELRAQLIEERGATLATDSDAEVVVAAYHNWGPSAVNRLRGMFAFVIWDSSARRAFGARDAFGIKPLYQLVTPSGVYFASEKKALLDLVSAELDPAALQHFLTLQYVPETATMHRAITRLAAGESFVHTPGGPVANRRYSRLSYRPGAPGPAIGVQDVLRDSVKACLTGDEPVGVFLSSGIDSAAVAALAREERPSIRAYTVGFDAPGFSEIPEAAQTAAFLDLPHTPVIVTPQDVIRALPTIVWHLDDPFADPAAIPLYFLAQAARRDVRVALSGDGADELFGGYPIYHEPLSLATVSHLPDTMQRGLRAVSRVIPQGVKGKSFLERGTTPIEARYAGNVRIFSEEDKVRLLRHFHPEIHYTDVTASVYAEAKGLDDVATMQYVDLYTWLRGDILVRADRMSMAHGLQLRMPYLDRAVFDVASVLPTEQKVLAKSTETKIALRQAMTGLLPDAVVHRAPGFITPIRPWLRGDLYDWAHDLLDRSGADGLLDLSVIRDLLRDHRKKAGDHARQIWTALMFCAWHAVFVAETLSPAPPPETQVPNFAL